MAHPSFVLFGTAAILGLLPRPARPFAFVGGALAALALVAALPDATGVLWTREVAGYPVELLRVDPLSRLFALIFAVITVIGAVFALHLRRAGEPAAVLGYAGGAIGVTLAGDWFAAFLFWELMTATSVFVVWSGPGARAGQAGFRYLLVHLAGGALLLSGILLHLAGGGSAAFPDWAATWQAGWSVPAALMLAGVAVNAAIPPLHAWLTDAYPEASVTGTVFLSAFTTKTAVYLLLRAFPGSDLLLWAGVVMALYGVVYAVLENDIRRLLAYHIISQVGYMVAAAGMGTDLSLNGAAAHAFCHILYKALLLMGAGAVLAATGRSRLTELGGIASRMPAVTGLYMIGAFSISGFPLFNGFISKSVIVSAAADGGWPAAELLLTLASVGTFLHTGLKLPWFTFFGPNRGVRPAALPWNMTAAMGLAAALCVSLGVYPDWLYARLPFPGFEYHPYSVDHVVRTVQLLLGTGVAFWWLLPKLAGEPTVSLDTDALYRRLVPALTGSAVQRAAATGRALAAASTQLALWLAQRGDLGLHRNRDPYRAGVGLTVMFALASLIAIAVSVWLH
ncbi:MAG: Na(+)/H(+) antiporter subunit D [Acidimicrobiia bacterium]|nr:Na(+)/H(+) antiporter subunit D [Acidimicrobiia bacterium]